MSKTQFKLGRVKPEVVGRAPLIEAGGDFSRGEAEAKEGTFDWLQLQWVCSLEKVKLAVCDWLSLGFSFLTFRHFRHRLWFKGYLVGHKGGLFSFSFLFKIFNLTITSL